MRLVVKYDMLVLRKGNIKCIELFVREKCLKRIRGFYNSEDIIKVITCVRRCGKSSIMEIIAKELRETGIRV